VNRNKAVMDDVRAFRRDLHAVILGRKQAPERRCRAFQEADPHGHERRPGRGTKTPSMSTINTTPLVDVMLVLLIIFLITIPVVTTSIKLTCPRSVEVRETKPENIIISVDQAGNDMYWYDQRINDVEALVDRLKKVSR
jgi:hypothetical protein